MRGVVGRPGRHRLAARCALVVVLGVWPTVAPAHERSVSYSEIKLNASGADITLRMDGRDLTRLPESAIGGDAGRLAVTEAVVSAVTVSRAGVSCRQSADALRTPSTGGRETLRWRVACGSEGLVGLESRLARLLQTPHLSFVRIRSAADEHHEFVLHDGRPGWLQPDAAAERPPIALLDSFRLGLGHIAGGLDHLLFVLGLIVLSASLAEVAVLVTAFTLAHTITLAATVLGILHPATAPVEALIAVSIALVAIENLTLRVPSPAGSQRHPSMAAALVLAPALLASVAQVGRLPLAPLAGTALFALSYLAFAQRRPDDRRVRWMVAFVFGLLHGFGFAGALADAGFSHEALVATLVAFNFGVEAGQLLFVAMLWPPLAWLRRWTGKEFGRFVVEPVSVVLLAASVAWYALRTFA